VEPNYSHRPRPDRNTAKKRRLKTGGKLVMQTGLPDAQMLILVEKSGNGGVTTREILPVRFSALENAEAA
jgi:protein-L-isoaspartate O-methyltransferase